MSGAGDDEFESLLTAPGRSERTSRELHAYEQRSTTDKLWDRFATTPAREKIIRAIGPVAVTLLAAGTRLWNLGSPRALVFDETFYVKDAYTLSKLGYEGSWPLSNTDTLFARGDVNTFTPTASFVVHPPLGKWIISLGYDWLGVTNPVSWRIMTAIVGILAVVLVMMIAKYLFKSTLVATIAGFLMAIDGNAIVMSRVGLLDNFVMFFALLGFGAILLDRRWAADRLALWIKKHGTSGRTADWGPALWWRPWLILAGLAFGLDSAVKWSGVYFLAFFALYTLVVDAVARYKAKIPFWFSGLVLKQAPTTFLLMVPIALAGYMVSWTGWFVTKGGYDRNYANLPGNAWTGTFAWVPRTLQSFWQFETQVWFYNVNDHSPHPYAANPFTWLLMIRPTSMYFASANYGQNGCTANFCGSSIADIANPLIWYGGVAAAIFLLYRLVRYREWLAGLILTGLGAGYLPWLLYADRTVFQFYTIAFEPYMILAMAFVASRLVLTRADPGPLRDARMRWILIFLVAAVAISVFFWPLWTGMQIDFKYMQLHYWIPSWE